MNFPIFIMEKKSLLEIFADSMCYVNLFARISDEKSSAEDRMIAIAYWYLSMFNHVQNESLKKPFNPIAGEIFKCSWKIEPPVSSSFVEPVIVTFTAEQVSHHPTGNHLKRTSTRMLLGN